ncbi:pathogenesis-related thaumatin-like protein 3.5 [Macadamia integrifolia]|uniref:pathogenesis-related thaumatin-like protein 3.5 n=1 Tax=Macadamia integrifolia TaxID=60698 RepID=UPI001C4EFF00|nr:pathogenesis-related thaumatin-like protein 3.5 [Macadamia integrifolia]
MARVSLSISLVSSLILLLISGINGASFTLTNNCGYTVWPGLLSGAGTAPLSTTGFALQTGESNTLSVPSGWSGRLWGRTLCSQDSTGKFSCVTGDCGSEKIECTGGATPPATLAEFTLNGAGGLDFYDVSLVDGYNLPMLVEPQDGTGGNCSVTGCVVDVNSACPTELKVTSTESSSAVACKSACEAFGDPQYCCSGAYGNPNTCKPSSYSEFFKNACPHAYSYAYDDGTSTFTCANANYLITFCPSAASGTSRTSSGGRNPQAADVPPANDTTMIYLGDPYASGASSSMSKGSGRGLVIAVAVFAAIGRLRLLF